MNALRQIRNHALTASVVALIFTSITLVGVIKGSIVFQSGQPLWGDSSSEDLARADRLAHE